ncbi:MAG: DUF2249 domain-containing protein [Opitutales bacterium]|nr:DUF2249 domain-containing protein [Opitutales bacterium]
MSTTPSPEPRLLDVRPALARGENLFALIMGAKADLEVGQALHLIAPFEPIPLLAHFQAEGFTVETSLVKPSEWHIVFSPAADQSIASALRELDLRELDPPGPLHKGLAAAARLARGETLVLHTRFRPVHLFEELGAGDFDFETEETAPMHWVTHIWRVASSTL